MTERAGVTVVIPAHNEGATVGAIVQQLLRENAGCAVIVIDDGSEDDTASVAEAAGATVIRQPYCIGNGAAIRKGILAAATDVVVMMDGDGQHDPGDLHHLLAPIDRYDMVVGARTKNSKVSSFRAFGNRVLTRVARLVTGYPIADLTSGFRAVRRAAILPHVQLFPNRFSYPTTITIALMGSGCPVLYVPLDSIRTRAGGASKLRPLSDAARILLSIVRVTALFNPMRVFVPISGLLLAVAAGGALRGWGDASTLALVTGVAAFAFGLVADRSSYLRRPRLDR